MTHHVGGYHDPKAAKHLQSIVAGAVANAPATASPEPKEGGASVSHDNEQHVEPATGGPNTPNNTNNAGGGGGDERNNHGGGWFSSQVFWGTLIALIGATGLFIWSLRSNPDKIPEAEIAQANVKIAKATGMAPPGWVPGNKTKPTEVQSQPQPQEQPKQAVQVTPPTSSVVMETKTFPCLPLGSSDEAIRSSYRNSTLHYILPGQALRVTSSDPTNSCILVKVDSVVTRLEGDGYFMGVPHDNGTWWKCGTYGGQNDSIETCRNWLNNFNGKEVFIAVRYGGRLNIN